MERNKIKKLIKVTFVFIAILEMCLAGIFAQQVRKAELVVQTGHTDFVQSVVFSPDGKVIASAGADGIIKLWDTETGLELKTLKNPDDTLGFSPWIFSVAFSPDGKTLASGGISTELLVWDVASGRIIKKLTGHLGLINSVAFSAEDKNTLASGSNDGTVKLWSVTTGKVYKTLSGHTDFVNSVAFSPDGKILASGSKDKTVKMWDLPSGNLLKTLAGHTSGVASVTFSPDGRTLASCDGTTVKIWDWQTGRELKSADYFDYGVSAVSFTKSGKSIAAAGAEGIWLWDTNGGEQIKKFAETRSVPLTVAFSPDAKILASGHEDKTISLWDFDTGRELKNLTFHTFYALPVRASPDGKTIAQGYGKNVNLWDLSAQKVLTRLSGHEAQVTALAFSPKGDTLATGSGNADYTSGVIKLWDMKTGQELKTLTGHPNPVVLLVFSPDGSTLASADSDFVVKIWSVDTGRELTTLHDQTGSSSNFSRKPEKTSSEDLWVSSMAFSPDNKLLVLGFGSGLVELWNAENGKEIFKLKGHTKTILSTMFSPDGKTIISFSSDMIIKLWAADSGKEIRSLAFADIDKTKEFAPLAPNFLEKLASDLKVGRFQVFGVQNGQLNLLDTQKNELLASLIPLDEDDWAVITPDGLFDASPGARKLMHYVIGLEPVTLEQLKDLYYVPGLLRKIFKGEPLPKVELFSDKDLFPQVEYEPLKPNQKQLTLKLTNRGGGIGQVQILFNGKELVSDARPKGFDPDSSNAVLTVDLSKASIKTGEENKIEIVARNAAGSLSTRGKRGSEIVYLDEGKAPAEPPNIYVIAGGISKYTGDGLKLQFAAKDAEDFAKAVELGAAKLLGDKAKVHIRLLTSGGGGVDPNIKFDVPDARISTATKADFQKAFEDFRIASPNDVFIVYLSGHGVSLNLNQDPNQAGGDTYLYLTQEAVTTDKSVLAVKQSRESMSLSSEELKDLMKQNKALKQVLILDTCAAGAVSNSLVGKRDLPSDQIRAIERLKDSTGFFVLMGAAADAVSYEASQYGQGLLTYSLLQGMKGARLREDQFADVSLLFAFAQETVPMMAKNIGGIQRPLIIMPDTSASFDIGKFTADERKQISLSSPKPLILRPNLRNASLKFDNLKLTQMMTAQLREASYIEARGEPNRIVFVEADEMTDGVQPVGDYTLEGETLKISVILVKNNAPLGKEITVEGKISGAEEVIKRLVEVIMQSSQPAGKT